MTTLRMTLDPAMITADTEARIVSGTLVPYGIPGRTSIGDVTVRAGALELPDPITRVRLLNGHDRESPIGVAVALDDGNDALEGRFAIARTPAGDVYLAELDPAAAVRDGLSIELDDVQLDGNEVTAGRLVAVAAVPLPAYTTARAALAAEEAPPTDPTTTEGQHMTDTTTAADDQPVAELEAAEAPARTLTDRAPARTRPVSAVAAVAERLTAARLEGNTSLRAALADITPEGNGAGNEDAGLMTQALGELWSGVDYVAKYRPLIAGGNLTGTKVTGFRWNPAPTVADYAGNKADVPSNPAKLELAEVVPTRLAGAHDIDRIYRDLGDAATLASYWRQLAYSLNVQLDARALDAITTAATAGPTGGIAPDPMTALVRGTLEVSKVGTPTFALVSANLIEAMALAKATDAPVGPPMALPPITASPDLADDQVIVGTRPFARFLTFNPPVRVEAVNIPNGGIDAGLFSYSADILEHPAGVSGWDITVV